MAMVQALIHAKADMTHVDVLERTALHIAAEVAWRAALCVLTPSRVVFICFLVFLSDRDQQEQ